MRILSDSTFVIATVLGTQLLCVTVNGNIMLFGIIDFDFWKKTWFNWLLCLGLLSLYARQKNTCIVHPAQAHTSQMSAQTTSYYLPGVTMSNCQYFDTLVRFKKNKEFCSVLQTAARLALPPLGWICSARDGCYLVVL